MKPVEAARRWVSVWQRAWEALDVESIVALYGEDAVLSTAPFRTPYRGPDGVRSYVARVFGEEEQPRVRMGKQIVEGDSAAIPWWATLREEGIDVTLAGTSLLRFDDSGLVAEQWDTWNVTQGHHDPPEEWSPFA
jgi:hypothetical protein